MIYLLWRFDHGTPNLIGVYKFLRDAKQACSEYEREIKKEGVTWVRYGVTAELVIE